MDFAVRRVDPKAVAELIFVADGSPPGNESAQIEFGGGRNRVGNPVDGDLVKIPVGSDAADGFSGRRFPLHRLALGIVPARPKLTVLVGLGLLKLPERQAAMLVDTRRPPVGCLFLENQG